MQLTVAHCRLGSPGSQVNFFFKPVSNLWPGHDIWMAVVHLNFACSSQTFVHTIIIYSIIFFQEQTKYCLSNCHGRKGLEMEILIIPNFHVLLCLIEQSGQKILPLSGPLLLPYYFDGWFPHFFVHLKNISRFTPFFIRDTSMVWGEPGMFVSQVATVSSYLFHTLPSTSFLYWISFPMASLNPKMINTAIFSNGQF